MRADFQTFRSAVSVSIRALAFQALVTVGTVIYAALAKDQAAWTVAIFAGAGMAAWLVLAVVFDQHRRERVEAMEVEAMAASPQEGTSVFENREDFRPAAKRLAGLYKFFVPGASLAIAAGLIGAGILRFLQARDAMEKFSPPTHAGWALGIGIGVAALGFVLARYAAGLAKQKAWTNLAAGASYTVGTALMWLAVAIGHLVDYIGPDTVVRWLPQVMAGVLVMLGAEVIVHFVLSVYRPRRPGEIPRMPMESRLLGFAAAPDQIAQSISGAINYQLGFDVSSGWLYQLLQRNLAPLLLVGALVVWLLTSVVIVLPHQSGMILRFGKPVRENIEPGPHLKWMWPIETLYVPEFYVKDEKGRQKLQDLTATGLRRVELGTQPPSTKEPILWTNEHLADEVWQFVRIGSRDATPGLTDIAVVSAEIPMQYTVRDVSVFDELAAPDRRDDLLRAVARREVTAFFQQLTLDEVLGGDRVQLSSSLRQRIQTAFDQLNPGQDGKPRGAGVNIVFLGITGIHPPKDTAQAFEMPIQAAQRYEANISAAQTDAIMRLTDVVGDASLANTLIDEMQKLEQFKASAKVTQDKAGSVRAIADQELKLQGLLLRSGGSASRLLSEARTNRWTRHLSARGEASRFLGKAGLYEASPKVFTYTNYFDSMKTALADTRVILMPEAGERTWVDVDLASKDLGTDIFKSGKE